MPDRESQNYCNRECWQKAKAAEAKAARRVWWKVGRPTLRELEEAGTDSAGARRRWNSPIRKKKSKSDGEGTEVATPEQQKEINEALAKIVQELSPKFHRRI